MMLVPPLVSRKPNNALHSITCSVNERRSFYGCTDLLRFLLVMDSSLAQPFAVVYIRAYAFELPAFSPLSRIQWSLFVSMHRQMARNRRSNVAVCSPLTDAFVFYFPTECLFRAGNRRSFPLVAQLIAKLSRNPHASAWASLQRPVIFSNNALTLCAILSIPTFGQELP